MNKLEGIYTQTELVKMAATAQHLADSARQMAAMLIYCNNPEWHAQKQQDDIQSTFSELHDIVLGLESEELTEAHRVSDEWVKK